MTRDDIPVSLVFSTEFFLAVSVYRLGSRSVTASVGVQLVQALAAVYHVSSQHGPFILHSYFCPCKIMRTTLTNTRLARG